ncbi:nucleolus protein [Dissoconium aciculare CBS 342.82]|uniref:25S rRNA adenine-N(1) methyltransferase n=1 Tax=Dissoconium aciculare CBS 342.82 TaxID=1314786 RepID=A0A6J3M3U8_9PEZI|nr:nucleolus protein [Dissoconium aciculare CBS 342.82]KAF1822695.1 nucleolus protein [Dissoconium aciculare CBS 342.82]
MSKQSTSLKSLKSGRPPIAKKPRTLAARHTRRIIRAHHTLNKQLTAAQIAGDHDKIKSIESQLNAQGGLAAYQEASIQGQTITRGGDSSIELVRWLSASDKKEEQGIKQSQLSGLSLLEVGALTTHNACSRSAIFDRVIRIDLNSQSSGISQQDFMKRPLPESDADRFDVLSLSLVLNYVPDSAQRGEMLRRTTKFLLQNESTKNAKKLPCLFLVLPLPCIINSRYMTEIHLLDIMSTLGYTLLQTKQSAKLYYSLWLLQEPSTNVSRKTFRKVKLNDGVGRNNFCVELRDTREAVS